LAVQQEHSVLPGLTVANTQDAFELEPHWVEWLGSIQAESFEKSSLYITAVLPSRHDSLGLPLHQVLDNRVRLFHHTLALLGCGYNNAVLMVGGNRYHGGSLQIGPVRHGLTPCFAPYYRKPRRIETADLGRAATILTSLETIYSHAPGRLYRRLRKGFNVWIRGVQEGEEWIERLHSFIRSAEAILKPTIAEKRSKATIKRTKQKPWRDITRTFIARGQTTIGRSKKSERLLGALYDIRSSVEHIKDVMPAVKKVRGIPQDEAFEFRALQSEILASTIYARILSSAELMDAFSTEARVEGFWRRVGYQRQAIWGGPIDLESEARQQFISRVLPDLY
jgi:hypothetical protein